MPTKPYDPEAPRTPGRVAFEAYGKAREWRAAAGGRIPPWRDIGPDIRAAWETAAVAVAMAVIDHALASIAAAVDVVDVVLAAAVHPRACCGQPVDPDATGAHTCDPAGWQPGEAR